MDEIDHDTTFEQRCPLCGGDNACAMAASPPRPTCWCQDITIDPALLAALPEHTRGKACLCRDCCVERGNAGAG